MTAATAPIGGTRASGGGWRRPLRAAAWVVLLLLALLLVVFVAAPYLTLNPAVYFAEQRAVYVAHTAGITTHVAGAMLAALLGPFQFLPQSRTRRFLRLHRWSGRVYLLGVLVGGLGGLYMSFLAYGGLPARIGFGMLAVLWLFTAGAAYVRIRAKQIESHKRWMIRNYALTFAAVTLRLWLIGLQALAGVPQLEAYITVAWISWVPNLLVAEWIVERSRRPLGAAGRPVPAAA
ncbi:MAG TPA: DUF2306 domain-containing protein [Chloroflexota bacterium]|nr:DUF2306 domain-containing protein [Chloroflexota bacterium]